MSAVKAKLAPGSQLTTDDQVALYRELMGDEKADRQMKLANVEAGRCACTPTKVKRRWADAPDRALTRTVHDAICPRWKMWMSEVRPPAPPGKGGSEAAP